MSEQWRLMVRRDRIMVPIWLAVLVITSYVQVTATLDLYRSTAPRVAAAEMINASPGLVAIYGPVLDVHSLGEFAMTKMTVMYAVLVSAMVLVVVRRHTRLDEEAGRSELLGGTLVLPVVMLRTTMLHGAAVSVLLGVLVAVANTLGGLPLAGSVAFGGMWAGTGLVAVGVAAIACQLSSSARTCAAIGSLALGVLFVVRAVGDTSSTPWLAWLKWLSPYGWNTQLRAYGDTRWAVLVLYPLVGGAMAVVASSLRTRRDLGSGMLQPRPGPAVGSPRLADVFALDLRLHRSMVVGWSLAVAATGLVFGAVSGAIDSLGSSEIDEMLARLGGPGTLSDMMFTAMVVILALVATAFGITTVGHMAASERAGRSELLLTSGTSRDRSFASTTVIALVGSTWLLVVTGIGLSLGMGGRSDHSFTRLVVSSLAPAPAVWVVVALALGCVAIRASWVPLGWGVLLFFATLGQIGEFIDLPQTVLDVSPYTHISKMPQQDFEAVPALVLTIVAVSITALSWAVYRHRDLG